MEPNVDPFQSPASMNLSTRFVRPASIVKRFSDEGRYLRAVNLFYQALRLEKPLASYALEEGGPYSFPVGKAEEEKRKDIELRLVLRNKDGSKGHHDRTSVYWEVKGDKLTDLQRAHREIDNEVRDFYSVDEPSQGLGFAENARSLLKDGNGNQLGLLVNPIFPRGKRAHQSKISLLLGALAVGLGAGVAFGPFLTKWAKSLRASHR